MTATSHTPHAHITQSLGVRATHVFYLASKLPPFRLARKLGSAPAFGLPASISRAGAAQCRGNGRERLAILSTTSLAMSPAPIPHAAADIISGYSSYAPILDTGTRVRRRPCFEQSRASRS
jgi:hypothetical protein